MNIDCCPNNQLIFCSEAVYGQEVIPFGTINNVTNMRMHDNMYASMNLSQNQFVPTSACNNSGVKGFLQLRFNKTFTKIHYILDISYRHKKHCGKIKTVYLCFGEAGMNGPIISTLYKDCGDFPVKRVIENNNITPMSSGMIQINNVVSIYSAIRRGLIYYSIKTEKLPDGAARGQIFFDS